MDDKFENLKHQVIKSQTEISSIAPLMCFTKVVFRKTKVYFFCQI